MNQPVFFHPIAFLILSVVGLFLLLLYVSDHKSKFLGSYKKLGYVAGLVVSLLVVFSISAYAALIDGKSLNADTRVEEYSKSSFVSKTEKGCLAGLQTDVYHLRRCEHQAISCEIIDRAVEMYRWAAWDELASKHIDPYRYFATCGVPIRLELDGEKIR